MSDTAEPLRQADGPPLYDLFSQADAAHNWLQPSNLEMDLPRSVIAGTDGLPLLRHRRRRKLKIEVLLEEWLTPLPLTNAGLLLRPFLPEGDDGR